MRGVEVVQCVQDLQHDVPLVANKTTAVRVYLDPATVARPLTVMGEIAWRREGSETYLPAFNTVKLDPAMPATLADQRSDIARSLNFRLPAEAVGRGSLQLRLTKASAPGIDGLAFAEQPPVTVEFVSAPPLRIRVIGLRYKIDGTTKAISPAAIHFAYLKSFLARAYPVASLEWSQIVVDADFTAPFKDETVDLANAQLAALRSREVSAEVDPRTHYFGLVDDNGGQYFMRGKAYAIPSSAQPDTVAAGPAGVPNGFAGDRDASYADWYGAHELGHTFGRYHPGFPPGQQDASDPEFPYPEGLISSADGRYVGFDVGDAELGLPMLALAGNRHHDVMTYADNQWLSKHTYGAILDRLLAEDRLGPPVG